jgi:hypothetical protein
MPIRRSLRWYYPIDWKELSRSVRFGRAKGRCETCRRPHGLIVQCLPDGRWLDMAAGHWRNGQGQPCPLPSVEVISRLRQTRVYLAAAHLDHDPTHNHMANLRGLCQRCHMLHDRPHHLAQRRLAFRRRWALGDLFLGRYS